MFFIYLKCNIYIYIFLMIIQVIYIFILYNRKIYYTFKQVMKKIRILFSILIVQNTIIVGYILILDEVLNMYFIFNLVIYY